MTTLFFEMNGSDISSRIADEGRVWIDAARATFGGSIIVGKDLMEI